MSNHDGMLNSLLKATNYVIANFMLSINEMLNLANALWDYVTYAGEYTTPRKAPTICAAKSALGDARV